MNGFIGPEFDDSVPLCKKGEVVSDPDKISGAVTCSPLANDNTACADLLSAIGLHTETLGIGISSVSRTTLTFCMCHFALLKRD